ncbi:hypothetical protein Tco_1277667 [Tanacetum coccineum]
MLKSVYSIDLEKPLVKDEDADDVDVHLYTSMIGTLIYLITSRPYIMFAVCLWYSRDSRDSPFELVAYTDSDYAGATQDRKSTTGGCQFLGNRLISWQCKKQTVVATSTTEAEYVAAASCCGQVLWIQNQLLDYGYNFMNTMIHIDNNSTICIIENPVQHSKTKHIEIRHHFIRDCNAKKLIQMVKIDTEHNVADLLTKGFDAGRFQYLVSSKSKRGRDTKVPQSGGPPVKVGDEAVHKELGDRMERAATTASSLEAEQESVTAAELLTTVRHHLVLPVQVNVVEGDFINTSIQGFIRFFIRFQSFKHSLNVNPNSISLLIIKTHHSVEQEQSAKVDERDVSTGVKDTVAPTILVTTTGEGVTATKIDEITTTSAPTTAIDEITLAQTLIEIKAAKPKVVTTAATTTTTTRPKARGVVVQEPRLQEELQAELEEVERLARQKEEDANIAEWDNVQAMIDADYELAA